jgi:hypothetical protein
MNCRSIALAAFFSFSLALPAAAQQSVDVSKLPVNLDRIQRQLNQSQARENPNGLNLSFFVDVYGRAPRIELWTPEPNLLTGPAPYGAPTHRQMIEQITPQEYRAPAADFSALFRWLADKAKDKK